MNHMFILVLIFFEKMEMVPWGIFFEEQKKMKISQVIMTYLYVLITCSSFLQFNCRYQSEGFGPINLIYVR